jgi:hypothetical protein
MSKDVVFNKTRSAKNSNQQSVVPTSGPEPDWNEEIEDDIQIADYGALVIYSRDWTIETINNQIVQQNVDLNPKFQRRNAWTDERRSKLIESLIVGLPVPEIVLAEHPTKKKSFIVIDGKQRLLTVAGFIDPTVAYWKKAELKGLKVRPDLAGTTFANLNSAPSNIDDLRKLMNADLRCTVIANVQSEDVLYDIFYRLNTGSVPLSTQELRQVLHKGKFADYLMEATSKLLPIHKVLGLSDADARLRDAEIVLRFMALVLFPDSYRGNLKAFLDSAMKIMNADWDTYKSQAANALAGLNASINTLNEVFGYALIGRKFTDGSWESRFNRVLFEVEAFYFRFVPGAKIRSYKQKFLRNFERLCSNNREFRSSIESTTKTNERYETRFALFQETVNTSFGLRIDDVPIRVPDQDEKW